MGVAESGHLSFRAKRILSLKWFDLAWSSPGAAFAYFQALP
jgi:hypothetical protein